MGAIELLRVCFNDWCNPELISGSFDFEELKKIVACTFAELVRITPPPRPKGEIRAHGLDCVKDFCADRVEQERRSAARRYSTKLRGLTDKTPTVETLQSFASRLKPRREDNDWKQLVEVFDRLLRIPAFQISADENFSCSAVSTPRMWRVVGANIRVSDPSLLDDLVGAARNLIVPATKSAGESPGKAAGQGGKARNRKRVSKTAKTAVLVEQALRNYHKFNCGIVDETVPPTSGRKLAASSNNAFSARAVDRWINARFGSKKAYETACLDGSLGKRLALNLDDLRAFGTFDHSSKDVTDDESSGDDDETD